MKYAYLFYATVTLCFLAACQSTEETKKPNIVLIMSDDQGYGQVGYYNHPILKTPNINDMAKNGLTLHNFHAGAPVCSPTRATVLTGRASWRTGVYEHGYPLRIQEKTIAAALKAAGYHTAHFGKWHLDGLRGPGVPIYKEDRRNPGFFGFEEWISVTNFFDVDPIMSHQGEFKEYTGSSSAVIVNQALDYIAANKNGPFFVVIWYGSPHNPWTALSADKEGLPPSLEDQQKEYLGEIVELDRGIGQLRDGLKNLGVSQNTLVWYNSDNGGLREGGEAGVGGLRGFKGSIYEGGLRVPCIIEWPEKIQGGRASDFPASTMDIFPTISALLQLPDDVMSKPIDGTSLLPLLKKNIAERTKPIPFKYKNKGALIDNDYKLIAEDIEKKEYALYNLKTDREEKEDVLSIKQEKAREMISYFENWLESIDSSVEGNDYKGGLSVPDPEPQFWWDTEAYQPFIERWKDRPEYRKRLENANKL